MKGRVVRTFFNPEHTRKVVIFERSDGSFGFEEWKYGDEERAWFPFGQYTESFIKDLESAIEEARERVTWLSKSKNDDTPGF